MSEKQKNIIVKRKSKSPKIITKEWLLKELTNINNVGSVNYSDDKYKKIFNLKHDYSYYLEKIYNTNDIDDFNPELEFCESDEQQDIWLGLRLKISSFEYSKMCGRVIKILIRDKTTKKYVELQV